MAIDVDVTNLGGAVDTGTVTSRAFNTTSAVAAGGFIVVMGGWFGAAGAVVSSVSGGGLTWSVDKYGSVSNNAGYICSAQAPSGLASGTTITVNFDIPVQVPTVSGVSFTGVATSSPVDGTALGPTGVATAAWTSGNYVTSGAAVIVAVNWNGGAVTSNTPTSPSVETGEYLDPGSNYGHVGEYRIEAASGSFPVAGTWNAATANTTVAVAYTTAAGSPVMWLGTL